MRPTLQQSAHLRLRLGWLATAAHAAFLIAPAHAQDAKVEKAAAIRVAAPAWADEVDQEQQAVVDVWFGGKRIGEAKVTYRTGALTFADAATLVAQIPGIRNKEAVVAALAQRDLPSHPGLACTRGADPSICGKLAPDIAGVIFSEDRFRIDLFVSPQYLAVQDEAGPRYLPAPGPGLSVVDTFGAVLSGSSRGRTELQPAQPAGHGRWQRPAAGRAQLCQRLRCSG